MNLRRATEADAAQACEVLRRSITELCRLDHGGDAALLARWLSNKTVENAHRWIADSHFFVAEENGRLLGCAAMNAAGKITLNYVAPEARFRGVSKSLVVTLEATATKLGLAECRLESTQTALRFYRGHRVCGRRGELHPAADGHTGEGAAQAALNEEAAQ